MHVSNLSLHKAPNVWWNATNLQTVVQPIDAGSSPSASRKEKVREKEKEKIGRHPFDKRRKRTLSCVKCGNDGHVYRECNGPITSFGIIAMRQVTSATPVGPIVQRKRELCSSHAIANEAHDANSHSKNEERDRIRSDRAISYLMVQRRDTMGYVDFVRGRWPDHNPELQSRVLKTYLEEMTCEERARLRSMDFESLWDLVWTDHLSRIYISEGQEARNRFEKLDIPHLLATTTCCYTEPEYGFPKGRKNMYESNLDCAKREFQEETGYRSEQYRILSDVPWVESFVGTNGIPYRHIYYAAEVLADSSPNMIPFTEVLREGEVSNMAWFTFPQCMTVIRPYDTAKKALITAVHGTYSSRRSRTVTPS